MRVYRLITATATIGIGFEKREIKGFLNSIHSRAQGAHNCEMNMLSEKKKCILNS